MTATAREAGNLWENAALTHLQAAGLRALERNFNCRWGEIDLIMRDGENVVFVEVRYRRSGTRGDGVASVGTAKRSKLVRAAQVWLQAHPTLAMQPCRFDVIGCAGTPQRPVLDWMRAAFDAEF